MRKPLHVAMLVGLAVFLSMASAPGLRAEAIGGGWECTLYENTLFRNGVAVLTWYTYEDCTPVSGTDVGTIGSGGGSADPFSDCKDTCDKPCRDWNNSCQRTDVCNGLVSCKSCCYMWAEAVRNSRGCNVRCKAETESAKGACQGDCGNHFNN